MIRLPRSLSCCFAALLFVLVSIGVAVPTSAQPEPQPFPRAGDLRVELPSWGGWANLVGSIRSPQCLSSGQSKIECFAISAAGDTLERRWWDGTRWLDWTSSSGVPLGPFGQDVPDCLLVLPGRIHCFALGSDKMLYHRWFDGGSLSWWENLGGQFTSDPACVASGPANQKRIDCFALGDNGTLWRASLAQGRWSGWVDAGGAGEGTRDDRGKKPACVLRAASQIDCLVLSRTSHTVQHFAFNTATGAGTWANPDFGGTASTTVTNDPRPPKCYATDSGQIMCMVPIQELGLLRATFDGTAWRDENIDDAIDARLQLRAYEFDCVSASLCFELFEENSAVSPTGRRVVFRELMTPQAPARPYWREVGLSSAPASVGGLTCTSWGPGRVDCFTASGSLFHVWRRAASKPPGRWTPRRPIVNP